MREIDELRPLTAGRLLALRRELLAEDWDELERGLRSNAAVLAEVCFLEGRRAFADGAAVLAALTAEEMALLLGRLGRGGQVVTAENPAFDPGRFRALGREAAWTT